MCQRTRGERGSSREVDGEGDRVWLNVLYHFPLPLSFGHTGSGTQTAIRLTVLLILFSISYGLEKKINTEDFSLQKIPHYANLT